MLLIIHLEKITSSQLSDKAILLLFQDKMSIIKWLTEVQLLWAMSVSHMCSACLSVCLLVTCVQHVCLSLCQSHVFNMSVCLLVTCVQHVCLSVSHMCAACLSVCLSVCQSHVFSMSVCLSVSYMSVCLSVCQLHVCLSVCLLVTCLPVCLSVCPSVCQWCHSGISLFQLKGTTRAFFQYQSQ